MSEYPAPWHRIDPADWPAVGRRIRSLICAAAAGRLDLPPGVVAGLRRMLPPPLPPPKVTPPNTQYGHGTAFSPPQVELFDLAGS